MQAVICCLTLNQNPPALILHKHKHKRRQLLSLSLSAFGQEGKGCCSPSSSSSAFPVESACDWGERRKQREKVAAAGRRKEGRKGRGPKSTPGQSAAVLITALRTLPLVTQWKGPVSTIPVIAYLPCTHLYFIYHSSFTIHYSPTHIYRSRRYFIDQYSSPTLFLSLSTSNSPTHYLSVYLSACVSKGKFSCQCKSVQTLFILLLRIGHREQSVRWG